MTAPMQTRFDLGLPKRSFESCGVEHGKDRCACTFIVRQFDVQARDL
jgi:hypothetical protein